MAYTENDLAELEDFFKSVKLPPTVQLTAGVLVTDTAKFLESHFAVLREGKGKPVYDAFYQRLLKLKEIVQDTY